MAKTKIRTAVKVSLEKPADEQQGLHNRWHPDIPSAASVEQGEVVKLECLDWTGGQIKNDDNADDVKFVDTTKIHYLTGPLEVKGASPGDVLIVEIQDVQPLEEQPWGYCGIFAKENGGGFLDEHYPKAAKAIWDFEGIHASSRHIPGVRFAGLIHPGIIGVAPSQEILETWNKRESALVEEYKSTTAHSHKVVANLPNAQNSFAGVLADQELQERVAKEGARTIPGRPENGGNCDIKNLSRGSKVYLPIHVPGAKLSIGDLHFSQGDGEITFCGAIEMAGTITIKCNVIKNGIHDLDMVSPLYIPGPVEPHYGPNRYLTFEGFSVDENGRQLFLDTTVAYRQSCLRAIEYFRRFGYNDYQVYLLLGCAPVQGHIAGVVDVPNSCTTLGVPMDIFEFDVTPEQGQIAQKALGSCAFATGEQE